MKKWFLLTCMILFLSFGQTAFAERWISVGSDTKGYEWFYDADSVLVDEAGHYTLTYSQVHPKKKTWYKGELSIIPLRRLSSLNRWEEHRVGKSKYTYWTYDYKLKSYTTNTMYDSLGKSLLQGKWK